MAEPTVTVEVDTEIGAAYVHLSDAPVARTEEYSDEIAVDLDSFGVIVGIELLDTSVTVPLDELAERYHFQTRALTRLLLSLKVQPAPSATVASAGGSARRDATTYGSIRTDSGTNFAST